MISIIICSVSPELRQRAVKNFSETIGCAFEIIAFDNRETNYGICKVYNDCARSARFSYLAFIHEDVEIRTKRWGELAVAYLESNPDVGMFGVAGIGIVGHRNFNRVNPLATVINLVHDDKRRGNRHRAFNPKNVYGKFPVAAIDGCFFLTPRNVWQTCLFDEKTFDNFHLYDMDYSMQVGERYKLMVTTEWDVTHFSMGSYDKIQTRYHQKFIEKWQAKLPRIVLPQSTDKEAMMDAKLIEFYLHVQGGTKSQARFYWNWLWQEMPDWKFIFYLLMSHWKLLMRVLKSDRVRKLKKKFFLSLNETS